MAEHHLGPQESEIELHAQGPCILDVVGVEITDVKRDPTQREVFVIVVDDPMRPVQGFDYDYDNDNDYGRDPELAKARCIPSCHQTHEISLYSMHWF